MKRAPSTVAAVLSGLSPAQRSRLAAVQRDPRARALVEGTAPPARSSPAPSTRTAGAVHATATVRGPVVLVQLKGLRLVSAPNTREHWTARASRSRDVRALVAEALQGLTPPAGPWRVSLTRSGPALLDTDNLAASFKAVRDALAAWLGCDDGPDAPVVWTYGQTRGGYGATVVLQGRE